MFHKRIAHHIVNHVVPTAHNGFVPHILKASALWSILGMGVVLFGFSHLLHVTGYLSIEAEVYPSTIVTLTNQDRAGMGLAPLSVNPTLEAAARLKVQDMVTHQYFAHTSPGGLSPWHWFNQAGYVYKYAGENLAVNFNESTDVEKAWLNSPLHRANIMSANFTEIGIAVASGVYKGNTTTYVVELFGMPAVAKPVSAPVREPSVSTTTPTPAVTSVPKVAPATVAGEATQSAPIPQTLRTLESTEEFVSVENTDPTLEEKPVVYTPPAHVSWSERVLLNADKYIGTIIEIFIGLLIIATLTLVSRERERHHYLHMAYGMLMMVILTSALFVGRIGVFAEDAPSFDQTTAAQ